MKKWYRYLLPASVVIVNLLLTGQQVHASSSVVISELSMGSATSATDEFVELYNNSNDTINMNGWSLYYRSATGTSYTKKASFVASSVIEPHSFFLVSTSTPNNLALISGMSQTGGVMELKNDKSVVVDRVGYGNATLASGKPTVAVQAGESLYRQYDEPNLQMVDTLDNLSDFYIASTLTPSALPAAEVEEVIENISYPVITINELYPNPTIDQSETNDEFIELYNPTQQPVDLTGWLLKDASNKTFIIKNTVIPAQGYAVFTSSETHLSLNNTGDIVMLYSPDSTLKDETQDYGDAKEGLSWGIANGAWAWNNAPTPASTNSDIYLETVAVKPVAVKSATAKKTTNKKATAKKVAVAKKASTKKPKASKLSATNPNGSSTPTNALDLQSKFANLWPWLLILLGTGTIGYGIYEYRPEISNTYHQLKNKLRANS